jgi:hypothetical protein
VSTEVKMTKAEEEKYRKGKIKEWRERAIDNVQQIIDTGAVDEEEVVVRDTICNLMHWCDELKIDFTEELRSAGMHFDAEIEGIE